MLINIDNADALLVKYRDKDYHYVDLLSRINLISVYLDDLEEELGWPCDVIAVQASNRMAVLLLLYTTLFTGRQLLPLADDLSEQQRQTLLRDAAADALFTDAKVKSEEVYVSDLKWMSFVVEDKVKSRSREIISDINQHAALIVATSGTTAQAKLVRLGYQNINAHVSAFNQQLGPAQGDVWLHCLPMHNIAGLMIVMRCLSAGAVVELMTAFDAESIWQKIQQQQVNQISLVPVMLAKLLQVSASEPPPKSLKLALVGGDKVPEPMFQQAQQAGWPLRISYGMTETCSTVAISEDNKYFSLLENFQAMINDQGVIQLRGPAVIDGCLNEQDLASQHFSDGWLLTRDQGAIDSQGLSITTRVDTSIISGGQTLSAEMIEARFAECPYIDDVAIGAIGHDTWGQTIVALVAGDAAQCEDWQLDKLSSQYKARFIISVNSIPRNAMGKIDRQRVADIIRQAGLGKF